MICAETAYGLIDILISGMKSFLKSYYACQYNWIWVYFKTKPALYRYSSFVKVFYIVLKKLFGILWQMKREFEGWEPLKRPRHGLSAMERWKIVLEGIDQPYRIGQTTQEFLLQPYDRLMWEVVMPYIRTTLRSVSKQSCVSLQQVVLVSHCFIFINSYELFVNKLTDLCNKFTSCYDQTCYPQDLVLVLRPFKPLFGGLDLWICGFGLGLDTVILSLVLDLMVLVFPLP